MTTPRKKKRPDAAPGMVAAQRTREPAATPARTDVGGKLPGDNRKDLFYEPRVTAWLGVARKRIVAMRRRGLAEGADWIVHAGQIVYTVRGIQRLRDHLQALRVETSPDRAQAAAAAAALPPEEPKAPAGPPERRVVTIVRVYPNSRLMQARPVPESLTENGDAACVLVRVRDNSNFTAGMKCPVLHDPRTNSWQHVGRLPRRRGKW